MLIWLAFGAGLWIGGAIYNQDAFIHCPRWRMVASFLTVTLLWPAALYFMLYKDHKRWQ